MNKNDNETTEGDLKIKLAAQCLAAVAMAALGAAIVALGLWCAMHILCRYT